MEGAGKCAVAACQRSLVPFEFRLIVGLNREDNLVQYVQKESPPPPVVVSQRASYVRYISSRNAPNRCGPGSALSPVFSQGVKLLHVIRTIDQVLTEELPYLGRQRKELLLRRIERPLTIPAWRIKSRRWLIGDLGADILLLLFQTKSIHAGSQFVQIHLS